MTVPTLVCEFPNCPRAARVEWIAFDYEDAATGYTERCDHHPESDPFMRNVRYSLCCSAPIESGFCNECREHAE